MPPVAARRPARQPTARRAILKPGAGQGPEGPDQTTGQLQERLRQLGFQVPTDGNYGPATAAAVAAFQERHGLKPSGQVDDTTLEALRHPPKRLTSGARTATKTQAAPTTRRVARSAQTGSQEASAAPKPKEAPMARSEKVQEGLVLGTGSQPSRSIKDSRDTTPAYDRPIWDRFGLRIRRDLTIHDSRDLDPTRAMLAEATQARKAATNGFEFERARAREKVLRERLAEAFEERLHPRGRGGRWVDVLGKLSHEGGGGRGFAPGAQVPSGMKDPRVVHDVGLQWTPSSGGTKRIRAPQDAEEAIRRHEAITKGVRDMFEQAKPVRAARYVDTKFKPPVERDFPGGVHVRVQHTNYGKEAHVTTADGGHKYISGESVRNPERATAEHVADAAAASTDPNSPGGSQSLTIDRTKDWVASDEWAFDKSGTWQNQIRTQMGKRTQ